jgi:hypothetical protein
MQKNDSDMQTPCLPQWLPSTPEPDYSLIPEPECRRVFQLILRTQTLVAGMLGYLVLASLV